MKVMVGIKTAQKFVYAHIKTDVEIRSSEQSHSCGKTDSEVRIRKQN